MAGELKEKKGAEKNAGGELTQYKKLHGSLKYEAIPKDSAINQLLDTVMENNVIIHHDLRPERK